MARQQLRLRQETENVFYYERKFRRQGYSSIVGIDEAGRGPLAGPVVAAAVVLLSNRFNARVDDSKKLTPQQRNKAFLELTTKSVFGIGIINEKIIDSLNILEATRIAMRIAVERLVGSYQTTQTKAPMSVGAKVCDYINRKIFLLIDGRMEVDVRLPYLSIIKGDAKSKSIAAASIIAKVTRDRIMDIYDKVYPQYGFVRHKGYPTDRHRRQIKKFGPCLIHRKSFIHV